MHMLVNKTYLYTYEGLMRCLCSWLKEFNLYVTVYYKVKNYCYGCGHDSPYKHQSIESPDI